MTQRVTIVGGGIAGLTTAYYLLKNAAEAGTPVECTLIEGAARFGGKIITHHREGFIIEGGPDSFLTQKPWALALARELGLEDRLLSTNDASRKVFVLSGGRLVEMPDGLMLVVPTRLMPFIRSPLLSWPGKLRMGLDLVIPPRRDTSDESVASFIRRRLGQEALDKLAEPLMAGIHMADPEHLSLQATFERFAEIERKYGSLIRGMLAARRQRRPSATRGAARDSQRPPTAFMSLRGGLTELVEALVRHLEPRATLQAGQRVSRIVPAHEGSSYVVELENAPPQTADAVVLATPAYITADLVADFAPQLATGLRQIRYVSTATISLGYHRSAVVHPLAGFGFVIPASENRKISACTWTSTKFDNRAPQDHVLIRAFVGGVYHEELIDLPDAELIDLVRSELADIMGLEAEPHLVEIFRWPKSTPQYDVGHLERVAHLEGQCPPGMFLTGNAYRGVGIPDLTHNGQRIANAVIEHLARQQAGVQETVPVR